MISTHLVAFLNFQTPSLFLISCAGAWLIGPVRCGAEIKITALQVFQRPRPIGIYVALLKTGVQQERTMYKYTMGYLWVSPSPNRD